MKKLRYGVVKIIGGRYDGEVGYYDDDDLVQDNMAIVYLLGENPISGEYRLVPKKNLRYTTRKYVATFRDRKTKEYSVIVYRNGV